MITVRIICGAYGFRTENGRLAPVYQGQVVTLDDAEAEALIRNGDAEAVFLPGNATSDADPEQDPPEQEEAAESHTEASDGGSAPEDMTFEELKALAVSLGLPAGRYRSKKALRDAIAAAGADQQPPDLSASEVIHGV